jgi:type 1 glutamine amidotransferase
MTGVFHFMAISLGVFVNPLRVGRRPGSVNRRPIRQLIRFLAIAGAVFPASLTCCNAAETADPRFAVLVFSKTAGYRHDSIPQGIRAIEELGAAQGFAVEATEEAARFSDATLARYRVVIYLNTTGDILGPAEKAAFERYIRSGGGFVGIHSASDTEYRWPWYGRLVGAYFASHPEIQRAAVRVVEADHPSMKGLPPVWERVDEWYNFRDNPRNAVHVLATLDEATYSGGKMGADHPIAWCQDIDGGRSWYTAMGHTAESYAEPLFRLHLLGGIESVAGSGCAKRASAIGPALHGKR